MYIKELSFKEFDDFAKNHELANIYQTSNYALLMSNYGYNYEFIGYFKEDNLVAASLILLKKITFNNYYGYAPKGFLIDYYDEELLKNFTEDLKKYYKHRKVTFIKLNPEIAIGEVIKDPIHIEYNTNTNIRDILARNGYWRLKDNLYFESRLPRFNGIISLKDFTFERLAKNTKNKIRQAERKGLIFEKVDIKGVDEFYKFIKFKKARDVNYYKDLLNTYDKNNLADIFMVKIDYQQFLEQSKASYENELNINSYYSSELMNGATPKKMNLKMNSDKLLLRYKNDMIEATHGLKNNKDTYVAGVITIKQDNKVYIIISGFDQNYRRFNANYFLHYSLIDYYKDDYSYLDLNGMTGDFTSENPYAGLNKFKLGFNPRVYEFIGEYDLIINEIQYQKLNSLGYLAKEFNKPELKKTN